MKDTSGKYEPGGGFCNMMIVKYLLLSGMNKKYLLSVFIVYLLSACGNKKQNRGYTSCNKLFINAAIIDSISVQGYDFLYSVRDEILRMNAPVKYCRVYDFDGTEAMLKAANTSRSFLAKEISFNKAGKVLSYKCYTELKNQYEYFRDAQQNVVFRISSEDLQITGSMQPAIILLMANSITVPYRMITWLTKTSAFLLILNKMRQTRHKKTGCCFYFIPDRTNPAKFFSKQFNDFHLTA